MTMGYQPWLASFKGVKKQHKSTTSVFRCIFALYILGLFTN